MSDRCQFLASFPPIQSAIKIYGSGDGMRVQFDIPESEMGNALDLLTMRQAVLRVTVELEKQTEANNGKPELEKGSQRKPGRATTEKPCSN